MLQLNYSRGDVMPDMEAQKTIARAVASLAGTGEFILNEGQFAKLMTLCEFVDLYGAELGVKKMTIDANLGRISLEMFDVIFDCGVTHPFFSYSKNAEYLSFKKANDGICVTLGVERVWSKVE